MYAQPNIAWISQSTTYKRTQPKRSQGLTFLHIRLLIDAQHGSTVCHGISRSSTQWRCASAIDLLALLFGCLASDERSQNHIARCPRRGLHSKPTTSWGLSVCCVGFEVSFLSSTISRLRMRPRYKMSMYVTIAQEAVSRRRLGAGCITLCSPFAPRIP